MPTPEHHDDDIELPGWARPRQVKDEPYATNRNLGDVGGWIARAEKHSGPAFAPGVGVRKSSQ
jgi:hypothetical protein